MPIGIFFREAGLAGEAFAGAADGAAEAARMSAGVTSAAVPRLETNRRREREREELERGVMISLNTSRGPRKAANATFAAVHVFDEEFIRNRPAAIS